MRGDKSNRRSPVAGSLAVSHGQWAAAADAVAVQRVTCTGDLRVKRTGRGVLTDVTSALLAGASEEW